MRLVPFSRSKSKTKHANLTSARLILRKPSIDDFEQWSNLRAINAQFLQPWEPRWTADELSLSSFKARIRQYDADANSGRGVHWYLFRSEGNKLVGGLSLSNIRYGVADCGTLGYWIGQEYARQGLMSEAVNAVCSHAFGRMKLHRVEASTVLDNERSQGLLLKCGFKKEGQAREYLKINGKWRDHYLFSRLSTDAKSTKF